MVEALWKRLQGCSVHFQRRVMCRAGPAFREGEAITSGNNGSRFAVLPETHYQSLSLENKAMWVSGHDLFLLAEAGQSTLMESHVV